ncbi:MAG: AAA family ATPase, partial [Verrucomicrobiales bacterium]|nr:AAA family ATPase [Verrucomicrobiales bacterium]
MRDLFVDFLTITQTFERNSEGGEQLYGEVLFFPEVATFGNRKKDIAKIQESIVQKILENAEGDELQRRFLPESGVEVDTVTVELEASERSVNWREPLQLQFGILTWEHGTDAKIGYVPGLQIEVVATDAGKFEELLKDHILFALNRKGVRNSLFDLALLQRSGDLEITKVRWNTYPMTPRERDEQESEEEEKHVLPEVGKNLADREVDPVFERNDEIDQVAWMLAGRRATSVLLVGESGVGKTALVHHLAHRAGELKLGSRKFFQTSGSRIVAGMSGFGEWQERCRKLVEEAKEQNAVIFFGNLLELLQVGQSSASSESLGSFFRPYLVRGEFLAIAECTPAQLAVIEQQDSRILDAFRQLKVEPTPTDKTLKVLRKRGSSGPQESRAKVKKGALERLITLQERYAGYSVFPGKAVRFLERVRDSRSDEEEPEPIDSGMIDSAFAAETGMPDFLIDERIGIDLDSVRDWFGERILGQEEAVSLVVDTIAAIKARLT